MKAPHQPGASAPRQTQQPASAATKTPLPAHPADSAVSYIMLTTPPGPVAPTPEFWDKWGPPGLAFLGIIATLAAKWWFDAVKRKLDMKRKLYLKVADAMHEGGLMLGSFANTNLTIEAFSARFVACIAPLSKAELVAGNKLLHALTDLKNQFGPAYFELLRQRVPVERRLASIRIRAPFIDQITAEMDANTAEQKSLAVEGSQDEGARQRTARLNDLFHTALRQRQIYYDQNSEDSLAIQVACEEINNTAIKKVQELIPSRVRVLALMRKELKFRFNVNAYEAAQKTMADQAKNQVDQTLDVVRKGSPSQQADSKGAKTE